MKCYLVGLCALILSGCVTTESLKATYDNPGWPGYISKSQSEFDGRKDVSIEPGYLDDGSSYLLLGARWNNKMKEGRLILVAEWNEPINFEPATSLDFNIDGKFISLLPVDKHDYGIKDMKSLTTQSILGPISTPLHYTTKKSYWITRDQLDELIQAKKSIVRVQFLDSYSEQRIEPSDPNNSSYLKYPYVWAKPGLEKFLKEIPTS
ncbi:hypothetical protein IFO68_21100 [Photobacterium sp. CAU 1568]|uniref:Lipoprotein n=1 Tax=Photobacterium arenosum TaxID=2774143 RepID=A0ABR9BTS3_9GAMM|nr:hypothetical protein [Photobacterium arenosum]MBD8515181.1 hypothetical protein [Photobacterium arenosum]